MRRVYHLLALGALLNLLVLGGTGAYLFSKGHLSRDKILQMAEIARGDDTDEEVEEDPVAPEEPSATATRVDLSTESQYAQEIAVREMQRFRDEMDQRMALNNKIMLQITTRREALEREIRAFQRRREQDVEVKDNEGFKKELEIFESLKPSAAMELMLSKGSVDDAAKLMLQMESRKVAKIIEAAKTPADKMKLATIQERMKEVSLDSADKTKANQ